MDSLNRNQELEGKTQLKEIPSEFSEALQFLKSNFDKMSFSHYVRPGRTLPTVAELIDKISDNLDAPIKDSWTDNSGAKTLAVVDKEKRGWHFLEVTDNRELAGPVGFYNVIYRFSPTPEGYIGMDQNDTWEVSAYIHTIGKGSDTKLDRSAGHLLATFKDKVLAAYNPKL